MCRTSPLAKVEQDMYAGKMIYMHEERFVETENGLAMDATEREKRA